MKYTKLAAAALALSAATTLAACSSDENSSDTAETSAASSAAASDTATAPAELPTAADLNAILAKATDPNVPLEEKTQTVQGGESAPELFDTMAASKAESGATFTVVDPVVPGYTPDSLLTTVEFTTPDNPTTQTADQVEFVYEDGVWKLSQSWTCTLITSTVAPEQVPAMCNAQTGATAADTAGDPAVSGAGAGEAADPAAPAAEAPAGDAPAEEAPVDAPAAE